MRALHEVCALLRMTAIAGLRDRLFCERSVDRILDHGIVAVAACHLVLIVCRADPVQSLSTLMTRQALCVLNGDRRLPISREADDQTLVPGLLCMLRARPVACLADLHLLAVARIVPKGLGM